MIRTFNELCLFFKSKTNKCAFIHNAILRYIKGVRKSLQILPQYHANLTQPINYKETVFLAMQLFFFLCEQHVTTFLYVFYKRCYSFCSLRTMGKFTSRHLFSHGAFQSHHKRNAGPPVALDNAIMSGIIRLYNHSSTFCPGLH